MVEAFPSSMSSERTGRKYRTEAPGRCSRPKGLPGEGRDDIGGSSREFSVGQDFRSYSLRLGFISSSLIYETRNIF